MSAMNDDGFEALARELFMQGDEAISGFLGYPVSPGEDKDTTENRLREAFMQMPGEKLELFTMAYKCGVQAGLKRQEGEKTGGEDSDGAAGGTNGACANKGPRDAGECAPAASVSVNARDPQDVEVSLPLPDGGRLTAYTSVSDCGTVQAGVLYYDRDGFPIDLAMAESKRGELAEAHGLPADNQDIDIMAWADPMSEDYTYKFRISHADLEAAIKSMG